ncbi:hypothetical protein, partial [Komagataeibacter oboediens]|uniref:hypothetical protein n=1 Tax=Komagataeibacter oboediens TaxID=65958 RepID=UPI001C647EB0
CVLNRMDIDRLDPHAHTTDSKALSSLKNFRIGLSSSKYIASAFWVLAEKTCPPKSTVIVVLFSPSIVSVVFRPGIVPPLPTILFDWVSTVPATSTLEFVRTTIASLSVVEGLVAALLVVAMVAPAPTVTDSPFVTPSTVVVCVPLVQEMDLPLVMHRADATTGKPRTRMAVDIGLTAPLSPRLRRLCLIPWNRFRHDVRLVRAVHYPCERRIVGLWYSICFLTGTGLRAAVVPELKKNNRIDIDLRSTLEIWP